VREKAVRLYLDGETCTTVAAKVGVSYTAVSKWVIKARGHGARERTPHPDTDASPEVYEGGWALRRGIQRPLNPHRERT
jgi:transposase-like protein